MQIEVNELDGDEPGMTSFSDDEASPVETSIPFEKVVRQVRETMIHTPGLSPSADSAPTLSVSSDRRLSAPRTKTSMDST